MRLHVRLGLVELSLELFVFRFQVGLELCQELVVLQLLRLQLRTPTLQCLQVRVLLALRLLVALTLAGQPLRQIRDLIRQSCDLPLELFVALGLCMRRRRGGGRGRGQIHGQCVAGRGEDVQPSRVTRSLLARAVLLLRRARDSLLVLFHHIGEPLAEYSVDERESPGSQHLLVVVVAWGLRVTLWRGCFVSWSGCAAGVGAQALGD
mmetsp:Transcript_17544/g.29405  ORF Transcript_17544/g.29405 Transcript_17544/m.29405 type:complete len:207 (+) Transcript_17544:225-845(+)